MNTHVFRSAFASVLTVFAALSSSAATYYVGPSGSDGGSGTSADDPFKSLSVALARADVTEVRLLPGEYFDMETMTTTIANSTGISWLGVVTTGVKIVGAGADVTVLHAFSPSNGNRGGLLLNHAEAELSGVTITDAYVDAMATYGIAVRILSGTMYDCVLTGNSVPSGKVKNNATLTLESSSAHVSNTVVRGNNLGTNARSPAVYVGGGATLRQCTIEDNSSGDATTVNGLSLSGLAEDCIIRNNTGCNTAIVAGGVYMGGSASLVNCIVTNNFNTSRQQNSPSSGSAGGVYVSGANSVVTNSLIANNANYSSCGRNAGGLYVGAANVKVIDCEIRDNFSSNGAEVTLAANSLLKTCEIRNMRGAPLIDQTAGTLEDCIQDDGASAQDDRPAVCYVSTTGSDTAPYDTAEKATPDLQAAVDAVRRGGRVVVAAGTYANTSAFVTRKYNIQHSVLIDKEVSVEGPDDPSEAVFHIENTDTVKTQGGGFWLAHPKAVLSGVTLTVLARPADTYYYCGLALQIDGGVVSNCVVTGCGELKSVGSHTMPPVAIDGGAMTYSRVCDNNHLAGYWGRGAAGVVISAGSFSNGYVMRNGFPTANSDQALANGVYMRGGSVTDTIIEGNYGGANRSEVGAGVTISGGALERCIIQCNTNSAGVSANKDDHAGGVFANGNARIVNCLIAANHATTTSAKSAGGLYVKSDTATVRHVTVVGNLSSSGDGGIRLKNGATTLGSISAENSGTQITCDTGTAGVWTSGVIFRDVAVPFPVTWETADAYSVTVASAGYNAVTENYAETDLLGKPRPVVSDGSEDYPDAGAMEKHIPAPGEIEANVSPSLAVIPVGRSVVFKVTLDGEDTRLSSCEWTVTQGESVTTTIAYTDTFEFSPSGVGTYVLSAKATNAGDKVAPARSVTVTVLPSVCYVSPHGDAVYPYDTEQKAARDIASAIGAVYAEVGNPGTVRLLPGDYSGMAEMTAANGFTYVGVLDKPIRIVGVGGPSVTTISYTSTDLGGGFLVADAEAELSGVTITGSVKPDNDQRWTGFGNAVSLMNGAVSNCVITGCSVTGTHVVPLMLIARGLATDVEIVNNSAIGTAWGRGALGVYMTGGTLANSLVSGCNMTRKNYDLLKAGGVYMTGGCVTGCRIENNTGATGQTGSTQVTAGGILVEGGLVEHTLIVGNTNETSNAGSPSAGGLLVNGAAARVDHVTVADNVCFSEASAKCGAYVKQGTLANAIVWDNDATDLKIVGGTVSHCCWPLATGEGNVSEDPSLRRNQKQPYCINSVSPCSHTGESGTYMGWLAPYPAGLSFTIR